MISMCVVKSAATIDTFKRCLTDKSSKYKLVPKYVFWWKCFVVVIRKHCIELDDANKFDAKFQCTTLIIPTILFTGSTCLPILSPKPVAESASVDFIGRRRLRASFI